MSISSEDIIPFGQVRAKFTQLAEKVHAGQEKIITLNGESYIALVAAEKLDYYQRLEQENIHLLLMQEVVQGLDDVEANRLLEVSDLREKYGR
jgi:antitoxin (DNA-binding transcriptional repressor) of toxin-antitoxin stability system